MWQFSGKQRGLIVHTVILARSSPRTPGVNYSHYEFNMEDDLGMARAGWQCWFADIYQQALAFTDYD